MAKIRRGKFQFLAYKYEHYRSDIVPDIPGESGTERHLRRLRVNLEHADEVREWCAANDWTVEITEEGHHWYFRRGGAFIEWRPSSKEFFISRRKQDYHVLDYTQLIWRLEKNTR